MKWKHILLSLERIEQRQRQILERLDAQNRCAQPHSAAAAESQWLERGIDNILSYQVGKKKGGEEA